MRRRGRRAATTTPGRRTATRRRASPPCRPRPAQLTRHFVLPLDGRITGQVLYAAGAFFAATTSRRSRRVRRGRLRALARDVGQLAHTCEQLDGYGVVGTGVVDAAAKTLYVADAFGRMHAFALAHRAERPGWPIRVFSAIPAELAWGALALVDGSVFVPTAAYCDAPSLGGVFAVDAATACALDVVPPELGGGGGPWGWGGVAFDPDDDSALRGDVGRVCRAARTRATTSPRPRASGTGSCSWRGPERRGLEPSADLPDRRDLDFVGSPVAVDRTGCGGLVGRGDEERRVYAWQRDRLAAGPIWDLRSSRTTRTTVPRAARLVASRVRVRGHRHELVRIPVDEPTATHVVWRSPLGTEPITARLRSPATRSGSPTTGGRARRLRRPTGRTCARRRSAGRRRGTDHRPRAPRHRHLHRDGRGLQPRQGVAARLTAAQPGARGAGVELGRQARHGWQSRASGVYATDDAGRSWRRIYAGPATAVARLSRSTRPDRRRPRPGPLHVHDPQALDELTAARPGGDDGDRRRVHGSAGLLYLVAEGRAARISDPACRPAGRRRTRRRPCRSRDGVIVAAAAIPDGIRRARLEPRPRPGLGHAPRALVVMHGATAAHGHTAGDARPPARERDRGELAELTVTATDYGPDPARTVTWCSGDGGATWSAEG